MTDQDTPDAIGPEGIAELRACSERVALAQRAYKKARMECKTAKELLDAALTAMRLTVDGLTKVLPLFDQPPTGPDPGPELLPPGAVSRVRVRLLSQILSDVVGEYTMFGSKGDELDAYRDDENEIFLARQLPEAERTCEEEDGWRTAYLESDEFEVIEAPVDDAAWRATRIADLAGLTPKIVEVLEEHQVRTVGDWLDLPAKHGGDFRYTSLKGLTEARYDKIVEAMASATPGA